MRIDAKDLFSGCIFIAIGVAFCTIAATSLPIGTASRMGPGYFPLLAGGFVMALGLTIALRAFGRVGTPFGAVPWRGMLLISIAPIVFGICVRGLGLGPTIALTGMITCFASYRVGILKALGITTVLTAFCLAIFHYGLGLPIAVFGPWLQV